MGSLRDALDCEARPHHIDHYAHPSTVWVGDTLALTADPALALVLVREVLRG